MSLPTLYEYYTNPGIDTGLSANNSYFTLNNKNITIFSGAMHYFRVHPEYWRDRLRKMKAAGLNTVETYVPWNLHEPQPGMYDFGNGGSDFENFLDIEKFLKIAQEEDLFAILRPGPYICAEWEFGGFPSWLLRDDEIKLRSNNRKFMAHVERYFKTLLAILSIFQFTKGGPIIAFQIENEYGSLKLNGSDYLEGLKNLYTKNGLVELLFTSDGPLIGNYGQIPGILYTSNFQVSAKENLDKAQTYQPGKPSMVTEYWSGWFDHWTEPHHTIDIKTFTNTLQQILDYPSSVNFYMFHGGTSFGFMNGANIAGSGVDNQGFQPTTNSYDYDAPLNEVGDYTEKYYVLKELICRFNNVGIKIPPLPKLTNRTKYNNIDVVSMLTLNDLFEDVPEKIISHDLIPMETLPINNNSGQSYGYIVYRKKGIDITSNSVLKIYGRVCDTVMVLINGELKSKIVEQQKDLLDFGFWKKKDSTLFLGNKKFTEATIDLVVENFGRNNFGNLQQFNQHKGLWQGNVSLNNENISDWEIIPLEFKKNWTNSLSDWREVENRVGPTLYKTTFDVTNPEDTFINMEDWYKGVVIVNGFVLSRYFRLGPQQALYLPAPLLREGVNEICVFEHFKSPGIIKFSSQQIFKTLK